MGFVFYDAETTGTNTTFDQILQFAAIRTDPELKEIDRFEARCRLMPHIVPSPGAMRVTGTTRARLLDASLPTHYQMMCAIRAKLLSWSPAIFVGYSSLRFDEHLFRQALYKTLHAPYLTNTGGNARTDALRMAQAALTFAPQALTVPVGSDGKTDFKLDRLAPANGFRHANAHDALADVEATIFLCRLLMDRAPDVWSTFMRFSNKASVVDFVSGERIFCVADYFFGCPFSWFVTPIGANQVNPSEFYVYNLAIDPEELAGLSDDQLVERMGHSPKPMRKLKSNACPMLVPCDEAPPITAGMRLGMQEIERRADLLHTDEALRNRLNAAFQTSIGVWAPSPHVEMQIYNGFFSNPDTVLMDQFHAAPWEQRPAIVPRFADQRLRTIGNHLIHVERPDLLCASDCQEYDRARARRLLGSDGDVPWMTVSKALAQLEDLIAKCEAHEHELLNGHRQHFIECSQQASALIRASTTGAA
ncbi:Exodeoxyribonuclease I [Rhodovulum sp. PH10]|uniref:exonuclease domain-containing protein n=1 Tax=Rhodovulum sp. PH10 TaxID=1187851 RepID=UPI00027C254B|nr:exonuclease domain-containing protein [Rhodovulum sp. PH10]EJW10849.1 Exodeoxyribonuclease I [Rhodovulum sp. PH10]